MTPKRKWKSVPPNPVRPRPVAQDAFDILTEQLEEAHVTGEGLPNCDERPDLWSDNDDLVSDEMAEILCLDCPLLVACRNYALLEEPSATIMGGINWKREEWPND